MNLDELYELYDKKDGMFAKLKFKRMMKSQTAEGCMQGLYTIFNENNHMNDYEEMTHEKLEVVLVRLLNKYSLKEIYEMTTTYDRYGRDAKENKIEGALKVAIGIDNPNEQRGFDPESCMYLLSSDIPNIDVLISNYGKAIYEAIMENDIYTERNFTNINLEDTEVNSYEDFLKLRSNASRYNDATDLFNFILMDLTKKYTTHELLTKTDIINKEIKAGITLRLPTLGSKEQNVYSNNREVLDKMIDHFDGATLQVIENCKQYLNPILYMVTSKRLPEEDLDRLKKMYLMFSKISELEETNKYQDLLTFIETIEKNDEDGMSFAEIINNAVLDYEFLYRKEMVENTRSYASVPTENKQFVSDTGKSIDIECSYVDKPEEISGTLFHSFESKTDNNMMLSNLMFVALETVANSCFETKKRTKEDLKQIIVQLYELGVKYNHPYYASSKQEINEALDKLQSMLTEEEYEEVSTRFERWDTHLTNSAEVNQIRTRDSKLYDFLEEETEGFTKPLTPEVKDAKDMNYNFKHLYQAKGESVLAVQMMRVLSSNDFQSLIPFDRDNPCSLAITFDGKGLSEESILMSSTGNVETNNRPIVTFYEKYRGLDRRSATQDMVETTIGSSGMVRRRNSEIDLVRSAVTPQSLMVFVKMPITDKALEGLEHAKALAEQSNYQLVVVNYTNVVEELKRQDEEKANKATESKNMSEQITTSRTI